MKMDPLGVLFMFGILLIVPIQPMKAIGGAALPGRVDLCQYSVGKNKTKLQNRVS